MYQKNLEDQKKSRVSRRNLCKANARLFVVILAFATAMLLPSASSLGQVQAASEDRPNIVLMMIDDLGYGDLSCYGNQRNDTPNIDQLAKEGLKFTDFHSNGAMCSPTRASLLSGMYQNRFGLPFDGALSALEHGDGGMPHAITTIAEALQSGGYRTAMYGKWHLGYRPPNTPIHHGFDDFRGLLTGGGDHHSHINRSGEKDWWHNDYLKMDEGYSTDLITDYGIEFIEQNREKPFFLYLADLAIHFPWQGPHEKAHRIEGKSYWNLEKLGPHPPGKVRPVVEEMVEAVDRNVGRLMASLKQLQLDRKTIVIFCSDNGGYRNYQGRFEGEISDNGPFRGQKTELWEGGHRVPAIVWWPGHVTAGKTTDETTMTMDLMPTILEIVGIEPPRIEGVCDLDGTSLTGLWFDGKPLPDRILFWRAGKGYAVRKGDWKLVTDRQKKNGQLFNLAKDIGERKDLSGDYPEVYKQLHAALDEWDLEMNGGYTKKR